MQDEKGTKQIARFSKSKYKDKDNNAKIDETAYYANSVMTPLLGPRFVRPVTIGIMDELDFETVKMEAQPLRPLNRVKKDIKSRKVILSPDCVFLDSQHLFNTFGPTLSIEVKPKCGFFNPGTSTLCPRCLKQEAKLNEGNIDSISKYCPLDLFSGDLARMKRAIFDLFESPHNRFKVFRDGQLIYTEKIGHQEEVDALLNEYFKGTKNDSGSGTNRLASILIAAMLDQQSVAQGLFEMMPKTKKSPDTCDPLSKPLPPNCILDTLLRLQKFCLEVNDVTAESISHKLINDLSMDNLHQLTIWYPLLTENAEITENILQQNFGFQRISELKKLQKFLCSVTAKDVSVLFTFRAVLDASLDVENVPCVTMEGQVYRVMISVIDLDPKPVHRIPTWIEKRQDWLKKSYLNKN